MRGFATLILFAASSGCSSFQSEFAEAKGACEAYVKEQLKAPSTYKLLKASHSIGGLSKEQYLKISPEGSMGDVGRKAVDFMEAPGMHTIILTYEAENSFGAPLRSLEMCQFLMEDTKSVKYSGYDLKSMAESRASMQSLQAITSELTGGIKASDGCCLREGADQSIATAAKTVRVEVETLE